MVRRLNYGGQPTVVGAVTVRVPSISHCHQAGGTVHTGERSWQVSAAGPGRRSHAGLSGVAARRGVSRRLCGCETPAESPENSALATKSKSLLLGETYGKTRAVFRMFTRART